MRLVLNQIASLAFYCWIVSAEIIKIGYLSTCQCSSTGFTSWIFEAFHHYPYTYWHVYHGVRFLAGPYSLLWWVLNFPAYFGYSVFFSTLLLADLVVFCLLARKSRGYAIYYLSLSVWFVTVDPVDFWIIVFAVAGRYSRVFSALAPITKLPFGSELLLGNFSVWTWTFTSKDSFSGPENYGRYLILASVWLFSLVLYLYGRRRKVGEGVEKMSGLHTPVSTAGLVHEISWPNRCRDELLDARGFRLGQSRRSNENSLNEGQTNKCENPEFGISLPKK